MKWTRILFNKYLNSLDNTSLFRTRKPLKGSIGWNFLVNCWHLITKYLTWDIGRGDEVLFWEDSWNGHPPINLSKVTPEAKIHLKTIWGSKVKNYI